MLLLVAIAPPDCEAVANGFFELCLSDGLRLALCPIKECVARWDLRDEIPLNFAFPLVATFCAELKIRLASDFVVKYAAGG